jgi:hypothetical protein
MAPSPRKPCHSGSGVSSNGFCQFFLPYFYAFQGLKALTSSNLNASPFVLYFPFHGTNILFRHAAPFWVASNPSPIQTEALILLSSNSPSGATHIAASLVQIYGGRCFNVESATFFNCLQILPKENLSKTNLNYKPQLSSSLSGQCFK